MTSSDAESWARLRLVQGESSAQVWELVASAGQTTLTVGSNPSCNWVVREEGVAPVHFSLHWDGATLRLFVNGTQVASRALTGTLRTSTGVLRIGGTAVWSEWFRGQIDEVRIYNRALSVTEIQGDMGRPVVGG